ncbi:MAG: hypothetical protein KC621_33215 [Myxococcales bacterium]|nr:hypothetical protein [Myxococcales bacterium]
MTAGNNEQPAAFPNRTVAVALADVGRWRADEEARQKAEMVEVEQEIKNLQTAIANLQSQLDALHKFGGELTTKQDALRSEEIQRSNEAVLGALREQARRIGERDTLIGQATKSREAVLKERMSSPEVAKLVEDYRKFKASEEQLAALPESYRGVLLAHHESVVQQLTAKMAEVGAGAVTVDADPLAADVVYAIDLPDGVPDLMTVILPVGDEALQGWADREEGVQLWIAARVVQALHEASADSGWYGVQVELGGYEGLAVMEVDLADAPTTWVAAFESRLKTAFVAPPELIGARVAVVPTRVDMDYVNPPQDEEDEDAG